MSSPRSARSLSPFHNRPPPSFPAPFPPPPQTTFELVDAISDWAKTMAFTTELPLPYPLQARPAPIRSDPLRPEPPRSAPAGALPRARQRDTAREEFGTSWTTHGGEASPHLPSTIYPLGSLFFFLSSLTAFRSLFSPLQVDQLPDGVRMAVVTVSSGVVRTIGELLITVTESEPAEAALGEPAPAGRLVVEVMRRWTYGDRSGPLPVRNCSNPHRTLQSANRHLSGLLSSPCATV